MINMIRLTDSNVFNTDSDVIVNTINCVGFMGKGLAYEFSLRYPDLLLDYKNKCNNKEIVVGKMYYYKSKDKLIVNFPTKNDYKNPSKLEWIEEGLKDFVNTYKQYNIKSIAFPLLGCNNGGLNSNKVISLIHNYLDNIDLDVYICLDRKNPEGKELDMINKFKSCSIDTISNYVNLSNVQKESLKKLQSNITRFFQISIASGIGKKTYESIYHLFYEDRINIEFEQQSLF